MPNSLPEQKVTEEKKKKWGDTNDDVQFVCMGAKLQCQYCNPPMGDLMPTTEQIMLQDKPWATVGDKQPASNIIFSGLCMHPSQQRPLSSPPPCTSVIQLGDWENYSETIVGSHNALLKKSTIRCNISNQNITIMDSGQRATL